MERKQQLGDVAFGAGWSEQIAGRKAVVAAIKTLRRAEAAAACRDPRRVEVNAALDLLCEHHPKGVLLRKAWQRGVTSEPAARRIRELARIADLLGAGHGIERWRFGDGR